MPERYVDLVRAAVEAVPSQYYRVPTIYYPDGIVRERVFCYELYHQIRRLPNIEEQVVLHGELDKRGHRDFQDGHRRIPDLLFHRPGAHDDNTLVVEVKGCLPREVGDLEKDFNTLDSFITQYQYKAGAFVLYNHTEDALVAHSGETIRSCARRESARRIYLIASPGHGDPCTMTRLDQLFDA